MRGLPRILFSVLISVLLLQTAFSQVAWVRKFDDAIKEAQGEGKFIVVDFFADWCPPCREMAQKVYTDPEFIKLSRAQVFMLLNAELDSEGVQLGSRFHVESYPTFIILNAKGQEIDRLIGGRDAKTLIDDLQAIFKDPQPYGELNKKAADNTNDLLLQYKAGMRAFEREDYALAQQFLGRAAARSNKDADVQAAALLLLAIAFYKDGKYPEALAALDEFERAKPTQAAGDVDLKLLRGRILILNKRYDEGQKILTDLLRSSRSRKDIDEARTVLSLLPNKYRKGNKEYGDLLEKAKQEFQKGKLQSALSLAGQASDLAPQSADVHLLLAIINFRIASEADSTQKGQYLSTGLNELRFAHRLDPEDMNTYTTAKGILAAPYVPQSPRSPEAQKSYVEAENRFAQGRYVDAAKAYMKTFELDPGFGKAYLHCGDCFFANGNFEEALKLYQQAISKTPVDASAYRFAADALRKLGKSDDARRYIILCLLADPEYPMVWRDLEQVASGQGNQLQRHSDIVPIQFLLLGIDASTYDENIYENLPPQTVPAWREYVRNKLLWRQEKFAKAFPTEIFYHTTFTEERESLQAAIVKWESLKSQNSALRDERLDFLHQISVDGHLPAFIYLELFTEEYRTSYEKWKKEYPDAATSYIRDYLTGRAGIPSRGEYNSSAIESYNNALTAHKAGNNDQAIKLYLRALAQEPRMIPATRNLAILYFDMKDFANAREKLQQWSSAQPDEVDPYVMLAQIQARNGEYENAAPLLEKALSLEKDPTRKSQLQKMLTGIQSAAPRDRIVRDNDSPLDNGESSSEDRIKALEGRLSSMKDGEEKDSLILTLAVAHFKAQHWDKARQYASMILAKDPTQPTAKSIIEALQSRK